MPEAKFDLGRGVAALQTLAAPIELATPDVEARGDRVIYAGGVARDAELAACVSAEWMAARAGGVPMFDGGLIIGAGARTMAAWGAGRTEDTPGTPTVDLGPEARRAVGRAYVAAQNAVRVHHAMQYPSTVEPGQVGIAPGVLVAVAVVGVAAVAAGAWYAAEATRTIRGYAVDMAKIALLTEAAHAQLEAGQEPTALGYLKEVGPKDPQRSRWLPWVGGAALGLGAVGAGVAAYRART